jgi:branched-chain amino acid transport system permease protein
VFGPVVGAFSIVTMETYLTKIGQWVFVVQGCIFVLCVLLFRRGIVGELAALLRIKL